MIRITTFHKILFSEEAERNKLIDKMTEKNSKDLLKVLFKFLRSQCQPTTLEDVYLAMNKGEKSNEKTS